MMLCSPAYNLCGEGGRNRKETAQATGDADVDSVQGSGPGKNRLEEGPVEAGHEAPLQGFALPRPILVVNVEVVSDDHPNVNRTCACGDPEA